MEKVGLGKQEVENTNPQNIKVSNALSGKLEYSENKMVMSTFS